MPHISSVLIWMGATTVARLLILYCQKEWISFDRMIEVLPENLRSAAASARSQFPDSNATALIVVAGWSEDHQRFETYSVETDHGDDLSKPIVLTEQPRLSLCPSVDEADVDEGVAKVGGGTELLYELMEIQRRKKQVPASTKSNEDIYTIGGFIQETILTRESIETRIVKRWNDLIGIRIDPVRADAE